MINNNKMWEILIIASLACFFSDVVVIFMVFSVSLFLCSNNFFENSNNFSIGQYFFIDNFSVILVWLTLFISLVVLLNIPLNSLSDYSKYLNVICFSNLAVILFFLINNILGFWVMFELAIIPSFVLIVSWGNNPERVSASCYLLVYTVLGSLPLLFSIIFNISNTSSFFDFYIINNLSILANSNSMLLFFWVFAFLIKLPLYGFHLWLPKAHVEAPSSGSVILAAVMLKMGAYGLLRLNPVSLENNLLSLIFFWSLISLALLGLICFRSNDVKVLIAYSSVNHMVFMYLGFNNATNLSWFIIVLICLSHGFISSGLFSMIGIFYESTHSRNILINRAINNMLPLLVFFLFLFLMANCSLPTSIALFCEILLSNVIFYSFGVSLVFIGLYVFLSGLYCLFLYTQICHGSFNNVFFKLNNELVDYSILFVQLFPIFFFVFFLSFCF